MLAKRRKRVGSFKVGTALALGLLCAIVAACTGEEQSPRTLQRQTARTVTATSRSSVDMQAAMIDQGSPVVPTIVVARYTSVLDRLDRRCSQNRTMISDMAVQATQFIRDDFGGDVKILAMLQGLDRATSSLPSGTDCAPIVARLIPLMGQR